MDFLNKKILVVVAHPDDELLGLGASMNKLANEYNAQIRAVILGEGLTSRSTERDVKKWENDLKKHRENIHSAQRIIGFESVGIYDLPDNRFDSVDLLDIVKIIEKEKEEFKPEIIFTHHSGDLNIDHQRTFQAVITGTRPLPEEFVKTIISFPTPSATEYQASNDPRQFNPNFFIPVTKANLNAKIGAMEKYEFEKRAYPHPRSPLALETYTRTWGISCGEEYAEGFQIIRHTV